MKHKKSFIQKVYDKVRPYTPRRVEIHNGVAVKSAHMIDLNFIYPDYKKGLIEQIHENVNSGDSVTELGSGRGVCTVHASMAGARKIECYEASIEEIEYWKETLDINNFKSSKYSPKININESIVEAPFDIMGGKGNPEEISANDVIWNDVSIMDIEGSEIDIIKKAKNLSDTVVIESHPSHGAPASEIMDLLESRGYITEDYEHEPWTHTESKNVKIITTDGFHISKDNHEKRVVVGEKLP